MDSYKNFPQLLCCVDYKHPPRHSNDFRTLPRPIGSLAFVKSGTAEYFTEGNGFRIFVGDILFIPIGGTYISYWNELPSELLCFHFLMPRSFEKRFTVQKLTDRAELLPDFTEAIEAEPTNELNSELSSFRRCELFYRILGKIRSSLVEVETHIDPRIRPALDFLELHPEGHCTVGELARLCHMSESHFFPCFKGSMGRSPMEYRTQLLIMKAERLLETTELSISEISDRLGFGSETYFRRIFKAQVGISPREYRKIPSNR